MIWIAGFCFKAKYPWLKPLWLTKWLRSLCKEERKMASSSRAKSRSCHRKPSSHFNNGRTNGHRFFNEERTHPSGLGVEPFKRITWRFDDKEGRIKSSLKKQKIRRIRALANSWAEPSAYSRGSSKPYDPILLGIGVFDIQTNKYPGLLLNCWRRARKQSKVKTQRPELVSTATETCPPIRQPLLGGSCPVI